MSLTLTENGMVLTETQNGITMPADYTFATVNSYIHSIDVNYEMLEALCLGMASHIDKLNKLRTSEQRQSGAGPRFHVSDGGRTISDGDFIFDALIKVSGDFGGDELRTRYAQWICDALNETDNTLPLGSRGA